MERDSAQGAGGGGMTDDIPSDDWMPDIPDHVIAASKGGKPASKEKPAPAKKMKETPADTEVRGKVTGAVGEQLRGIVLRIEELEAQKAQLAGAISAAYAGAKANGFEKKGVKWVIRRRAETDADSMARQELEAIGQLYFEAVML